ncbi:MAG TPA: PAS domain S-box protein [Vicinamibacteria bacterium]|nr:PAS domain S-box protein [Vicinamibacteria bacterium]
MSEELRSAKEDRETPRELQSKNEELARINRQLHAKVDELERANSGLHNLLDSTEVAAVFLDPELNIRRFTPAIGKLLNLITSDVGRPFRDFSFRFTDERLFEDASAVIEKLAPSEKEIRSEQGRWYLRRILPYRPQDSRIEGVVITFVDITARKALEDEQGRKLDATEHRFRVLAENVPAFFAYVDSDERYTFVNKMHESFFGIPTEAIVGKSVEEIVGTEAYDVARPHIARALSGQEARYEAEFPVRGRTVWLRVTLVPDVDVGGRVLGYFALAVDTTSEKADMQALEESRDRLASVLDTVADAIITIDQDGKIDGFNRAAEHMFGYSADEAIGRNVSILMPEPHRSEHDAYIERYLTTGEAKIIGIGREVVAQRKGGSTFPIHLSVSEINPGERFTGIIRDVTGRKKAEADLERSREELRSLSARLLTAEESERRRISRELHDDLNQRLAMLSVDLETLSQKESAAALSPKIEELRARVAKLSDDVHSMAYRLHPAILDDLGLPAALRALIGDFTERHEIAVSLRERHFPARLSMTLASCFYRVVQESLTNIAKHSQSTKVEIRLVGSKRQTRLSIRDHGVGFDVEEVRNHRRTLGIVSMEERVRMVGGQLSVRSSPRKGTRISVTVPPDPTPPPGS